MNKKMWTVQSETKKDEKFGKKLEKNCKKGFFW